MCTCHAVIIFVTWVELTLPLSYTFMLNFSKNITSLSSSSSPAAAVVVHQEEIVLEAIKQAVSFPLLLPAWLTRERERKKRWDEERVIHEGIKNNDHQVVKKHISIHLATKSKQGRQKQFYLLLALLSLHSSRVVVCYFNSSSTCLPTCVALMSQESVNIDIIHVT